jgi:hypothetical protein
MQKHAFRFGMIKDNISLGRFGAIHAVKIFRLIRNVGENIPVVTTNIVGQERKDIHAFGR